MDYIAIAFAGFIILELSNVCVMYFFNETTIANSVGVFKTFVDQEDKAAKDFMTYLIYWVAGTKAIFISLLVVIIFFGDQTIKQVSVIVLTASIGLFYVKMLPLLKEIEQENGIITKNYARNLSIIIAVFMLVFIASFIMSVAF